MNESFQQDLTTDITNSQATAISGKFDPLNLIPSSPSSASFPSATAAAPALTVSGSSNYSGTAPAIVAPNLAISGTDNFNGARVFIDQNFDASKDRLAVGNSTSDSGTVSGIEWNYNPTTGVLTLSNNVAPTTYEEVLRQVTYTNNDRNNPGNARTIQFSLGNLLANPENGHFYQFVENNNVKWIDARNTADGLNYFGIKGYLATITSATEQQFIDARIQGNGWIGASDEVTEGDWKWVTGPENGQSFWSGGVNGSRVNDSYTNWDDGRIGEPNDSGATGEDYGHVIGDSRILKADGTPALGRWNDLSNDRPIDEFTPKGYIVEYGGFDNDPRLNLTGSVTLALSPTDPLGNSGQGSQLTTPDFNKDNRPDILWRNSNDGTNAIWVLDYDSTATDTGFTLNSKTNFIQQVQDQGWEVAGVYDINTDGISDIFWRNYTTGENAIWVMRDTGNGFDYDPAATNFILQIPDRNWEIEGVADFDNDGSANILWRNYRTGENAIWGINYDANATGNRFSLNNDTTKFITPETDINWAIQGWTDFNNDGIKDLLWRNIQTGDNRIWKLNSTASGQNPYFNPATDAYSISSVAKSENGWKIEDATDFNKDGVADILWRNYTSGENSIWIMQSGADYNATQTGSILTINPQLGWEIEGTADFTGDQIPDILWRNYITGEDAIWRMKIDGSSSKVVLDKGYFITSVDPQLGWEVAAPTPNNDLLDE